VGKSGALRRSTARGVDPEHLRRWSSRSRCSTRSTPFALQASPVDGNGAVGGWAKGPVLAEAILEWAPFGQTGRHEAPVQKASGPCVADVDLSVWWGCPTQSGLDRCSWAVIRMWRTYSPDPSSSLCRYSPRASSARNPSRSQRGNAALCLAHQALHALLCSTLHLHHHSLPAWADLHLPCPWQQRNNARTNQAPPSAPGYMQCLADIPRL